MSNENPFSCPSPMIGLGMDVWYSLGQRYSRDDFQEMFLLFRSIEVIVLFPPTWLREGEILEAQPFAKAGTRVRIKTNTQEETQVLETLLNSLISQLCFWPLKIWGNKLPLLLEQVLGGCFLFRCFYFSGCFQQLGAFWLL